MPVLLESQITDIIYLVRAGKNEQALTLLEAMQDYVKTKRNSDERKRFTDEYEVVGFESP